MKKTKNRMSFITVSIIVLLSAAPHTLFGQDSSNIDVELNIISFNPYGFDEIMGHKYYSSTTKQVFKNETKADTTIFSQGKIYDPISVYMPRKTNVKFQVSIGIKNIVWRYGINGWRYNGSATEQDTVTTPDEIQLDNSTTYFKNGVYMWDDNGDVATNMKEASWRSPVFYQAKNSLEIEKINVYASRKISRKLWVIMGITGARIINKQTLLKAQNQFLFAINVPGFPYNLDGRQKSQQTALTTSRLIGPSIGLDARSNYIKTSFQTALLMPQKISHRSEWSNVEDIVLTHPSSGDTVGFININKEHPFYTTTNEIIPHAELDISIGKTFIINNALSVRPAATMFASAFYNTPIALKYSANESTHWRTQKRNLIFYGLGLTLAIQF